jgi:hypothetical protein
MTNLNDFSYSFKPFDIEKIDPEAQEIFDARDKQLENYIKDNNTAVTTALALKADTRVWGSWGPSLTRDGINVPVSPTSATYAITNNVVFVNCEAIITTSTSFPGNQTLRFGLPIFAQPTTRVLGHGMFQWGGRFYHCLAFVETVFGGLEALFLPDGGQPWLGLTTANNPAISGNPLNNNFYMNLTYRFT